MALWQQQPKSSAPLTAYRRDLMFQGVPCATKYTTTVTNADSPSWSYTGQNLQTLLTANG